MHLLLYVYGNKLSVDAIKGKVRSSTKGSMKDQRLPAELINAIKDNEGLSLEGAKLRIHLKLILFYKRTIQNDLPRHINISRFSNSFE